MASRRVNLVARRDTGASSSRSATRSNKKEAYVTLSFINADIAPLSYHVTETSTGKDLYTYVESSIALEVSSISVYNSEQELTLNDNDNLYDILKRFMTRNNSTAVEIPLFEVRVVEYGEAEEAFGEEEISGSSSFRRGSRSPNHSIKIHKPSKKTAIVFDFDCTLTHRHWYLFINHIEMFHGEYSDTLSSTHLDLTLSKLRTIKEEYLKGDRDAKDEVINIIWGSTEREELIREFLRTLVLDYEVDLFISSRGKMEQIEEGLDLVNLKNYFKNFHAVASPQKLKIEYPSGTTKCDKPRNKEDFILDCLFDADDYEVVIYIDDDHTENRKIAREFLSGSEELKNKSYYFIDTLVKDVGGGIGKEQVDQIYSILNSID